MKYFVKEGSSPEKEVGRAEYITAERRAGFRPKSGKPDDIATGGFSSHPKHGPKLSGRVEYEPSKYETETDPYDRSQ